MTGLALGGGDLVGPWRRTPGFCRLSVPVPLLPPPAQFAEKFQEVKEAARLAREKSQDGGELTNPALGLTAHQVSPPRSTPAQHLTNIRGSVHCAGTQNQMLTDLWQRLWRKCMGAMEHVWGWGVWLSFGSEKARKPVHMAE